MPENGMTREEAITSMKILALENRTNPTAIEALVLAIDALRSGWIRTSERMPEKGLVVALEMVISGLDNHDTLAYPTIVDAALVREEPDAFVYWMPLPPLPEVEE